MSDLASRLKLSRERKGYASASDAARALGLPEQTYLAHENGSRGAVRNIQKYARFFKVSPVWLLTGEGDPGGNPIEHIYADLPTDARRQLLEYAEFLKNRKAG